MYSCVVCFYAVWKLVLISEAECMHCLWDIGSTPSSVSNRNACTYAQEKHMPEYS